MEIIRLNEGQFVIAPTDNSWETGGTSNSGAVWVPHSDEMQKIVSDALGQDISQDESLREGMIICLYSANGTLPGDPVSRQRRGLAVFTPELQLRYRKNVPVLSPDVHEGSPDLLGIEDARVTYINGLFYIWYCGYDGERGVPCMAYSADLLHWTKHAPIHGPLGKHENKDQVIFPEPFKGRWWMLHRPWGKAIPDANNYVMRLASAPSPNGPWQDEGEILRGIRSPEKVVSWVGGGAPPLKIGDGRYFILYHNGCFFQDGYRQYDACACVIDLNLFEAGDLKNMVSRRLEPLMAPQTPQEKNEDLRIDIIFPMSAHIFRRRLYFLYGAGDKATCAACVPMVQLAEWMA